MKDAFVDLELLLLNEILNEISFKDYQEINRCINYSKRIHSGSFRKNGDPYFLHPLNVALTTSKYTKDINLIKVALLHDVLEDSDVSRIEMKKEFGELVTEMVEILTIPSKFSNSAGTDYAHKSILKGIKKYPAILIVKLADQMHNLRTLSALTKDKQIRYVSIAKNYYLPLLFNCKCEDLKTEFKNSIIEAMNANSLNI